jgi:hypothetical protein
MSQTPVNEKRRNYRFYAGDPYEKEIFIKRIYFLLLFSAIHPAEKRLYANGDFEGVRSIEYSITKISFRISSDTTSCIRLWRST